MKSWRKSLLKSGLLCSLTDKKHGANSEERMSESDSVARNNSGGLIDSKKQVARLPYPTNLSKDYPDLYQEAVNNSELLGGADNGGTKLWWDKRNDKPYQN